MHIYLSFQQIADAVEAGYAQTHKRISLLDAVGNLIEKECYQTASPNIPLINELQSASDEIFLANRSKLCIEYNKEFVLTGLKDGAHHLFHWSDGFPNNVAADHLFYRQYTLPHSTPNAFEFDYVYRGACTLFYENTKTPLQTGDICLIAPSSMRDVQLDAKDAFVIQLHMDYDTFYSAFLSLLLDTNVISNFFHSVFTRKDDTGYLLLSTGDDEQVHFIAQQLFLEQYRYDEYAPRCSTNWLQQMFFYVLRNLSSKFSFAIPDEHIDFAPILKYLDINYRSTSLQEVADHFHYTASYLSTAIKKTTGKTYTALIRELKMANAKRLLENTDSSIEEIATLTGYHSADQFTKTFRAYYADTPSHFRKKYRSRAS